MPSGWPHPYLFPPEVIKRRDKDVKQFAHKARRGGESRSLTAHARHPLPDYGRRSRVRVIPNRRVPNVRHCWLRRRAQCDARDL